MRSNKCWEHKDPIGRDIFCVWCCLNFKRKKKKISPHACRVLTHAHRRVGQDRLHEVALLRSLTA